MLVRPLGEGLRLISGNAADVVRYGDVEAFGDNRGILDDQPVTKPAIYSGEAQCGAVQRHG